METSSRMENILDWRTTPRLSKTKGRER